MNNQNKRLDFKLSHNEMKAIIEAIDICSSDLSDSSEEGQEVIKRLSNVRTRIQTKRKNLKKLYPWWFK